MTAHFQPRGVVFLRHAQRHLAEENPQRRGTGIDHFQDRRPQAFGSPGLALLNIAPALRARRRMPNFLRCVSRKARANPSRIRRVRSA